MLIFGRARTTPYLRPPITDGRAGNAPSTIVAIALKALEFSAHKRIDAGERLDDVVRELLGDGPVSGALLLVIVDLVLSHSSLDGPMLAELVASTELLTLDATRAQHDVANKMVGGKLGLFPKSAHPSDAAIEQSLAERTSRTVALHDAITQIVLRQPDELNRRSARQTGRGRRTARGLDGCLHRLDLRTIPGVACAAACLEGQLRADH